MQTEITAAAAAVYFWARVAHWAVYLAKLPWLRTLAFTVGWICQILIAWEILFA
ncbi:MAG: MAPEG family protein [Candidatus Palauibacterales bacterium]|nr:MAPEG family protein [Candidatus Palauibacterales bacterium]